MLQAQARASACSLPSRRASCSAAMRGSLEAKVYRKELSQEMASNEVAEAQRQAREWLATG